MDTLKVDRHLTAKTVGSYVRHQTVGAGQLTDLITTVHRALGELGQPNHPEELRIPAVSVRRSVHRDYVVCLDCGYRGKTLRRHINSRHGLSRDEYRKRWGLRNDHPLTAPAYTERRSVLAKELGLGQKSKAQAGPAAAPEPADAAQESEERRHADEDPVRHRTTRMSRITRCQNRRLPGRGDRVLGQLPERAHRSLDALSAGAREGSVTLQAACDSGDGADMPLTAARR